MPRGARKDVAVTKLLRTNGLLEDKGSFATLPRKDDGTIHLRLKGMDMSTQRNRLIQCARRMANGIVRCALRLPGCTVMATEVDHIQGGLDGRCDCLHNLQLVCENCHRTKHVHVKWTPKKQQAHQDFAEMMEGEHERKSDSAA